jgi:hypothetical protein
MTEDLQAIQVATLIAWEEYYAQLKQQLKYVKGRGSSPFGHKYEKDFVHIAKRCLQRQMDVRAYTRIAIEILCGKGRRSIFPKDLAKPELMDKVKILLTSKTSITDAGTYWLEQIRELERLVRCMPDMYPDEITVLTVAATGFDAWFRVLYPQPLNEKLFDAYGSVAYEELINDRGLRDFLRLQVPDNMAELERRIARFGDT